MYNNLARKLDEIKHTVRNRTLGAAGRLRLNRQYRTGRTIAILFDDDSLQMATARHFWNISRLIDVTKIYVPGTCNTSEKRADFYIEKISEYVKEFRSPLTRFILGISGPDSIFRVLTMPDMPRKELLRAVYWEGNKRIPFGLENAYYGRRLNENAGAGDKDTVSTSLVAVLKETVDTRLDLMESLDIVVNQVHHEPEAIGCFLPFMSDFVPERTCILLNIRRKNTEISFYKGTQLQFAHTSSVGSESLAIGSDLAAEENEATLNLMSEIQNSLDYYVSQFPGWSMEVIYLYGDLCYSDELIRTLSDRIGIQFKRLPLARRVGKRFLMQDSADQIPISLGAVALCMAEYDMISFLPPKIKEIRAARRFIRMAVPAVMTLALGLLGLWASVKYQIVIENARLANAHQQMGLFKSSASYGMYTRLKRQMVADQALLEKLNREPTFLHLNLKELSRITPGKIELGLYDLYDDGRHNHLVVTGSAFSRDPPPEVILAEYIARLDSSPFFKDVSLQKHSKHDRSGQFVIDFRLEMEAVI
jgi:hypothetical protein